MDKKNKYFNLPCVNKSIFDKDISPHMIALLKKWSVYYMDDELIYQYSTKKFQ